MRELMTLLTTMDSSVLPLYFKHLRAGNVTIWPNISVIR